MVLREVEDEEGLLKDKKILEKLDHLHTLILESKLTREEVLKFAFVGCQNDQRSFNEDFPFLNNRHYKLPQDFGNNKGEVLQHFNGKFRAF